MAFEAEKAEIKKEIAEIYTEIRKYTDRCEELKKKAENKFGYYQEQLNVLSNTGHALKTVSKLERPTRLMDTAKIFYHHFAKGDKFYSLGSVLPIYKNFSDIGSIFTKRVFSLCV